MKRQLLTAALLSASVNLVHAEPGKTYYDVFPGNGESIDEGVESPILATKKLVRVWQDPGQADLVAPSIDSNIIFIHRCSAATPCNVKRAGSNNSATTPDSSTIIGVQQGSLSAFSRGDTVWAATMSCLHEVFQPFGTTITDVDPGTAKHYEIMVGGQPGELGFDASTGGVSPATCGTIPSSLVFVFDVWGNNSNEICATAAQEIAHSWALDHVTEPSDPMTYFGFNGRRHFKDAPVNCGSDCVGGSIGGLTCTGTTQQTRACFCGGTTQNSVQMIKGLFGDGTPTPPTVVIDFPKVGAHVNPGFAVSATITDDTTVGKAELYVDNTLVKTLTTKPFAFNAPDTLGDGTHMVKVTGYDIFNTPASATVQVVIGKPCDKPSDCPTNTDTCIGGRCVPGPGVQGGLGMSCTDPTQCSSGQCAMGTDGSFCVEPCALNANQCPSGFDCLDTGAGDGNGVCFPGGGGGGCQSGGSSLPLGAGLGFAALVFLTRRRRS